MQVVYLGRGPRMEGSGVGNEVRRGEKAGGGHVIGRATAVAAGARPGWGLWERECRTGLRVPSPDQLSPPEAVGCRTLSLPCECAELAGRAARRQRPSTENAEGPWAGHHVQG